MEQSVDITAIFILGSMCLCAVLIVAASLYYHYKKENIRSAERLAAIEKGIAPKDLFQNGENGNNTKGYPSKKDAEIYGGIKILIIGLFLALALYVSTGGDNPLEGAVWGLFIAGIGMAKIIVGMLMGRTESSAA